MYLISAIEKKSKVWEIIIKENIINLIEEFDSLEDEVEKNKFTFELKEKISTDLDKISVLEKKVEKMTI